MNFLLKPKIGVIDYGAGNVQNVTRAFEFLEFEVRLVSTVNELRSITHAVIPGVGSFRFGMQNLLERNLVEEIGNLAVKGLPILGICLGMQLLATQGFEHGETQGLGLIPGKVRPLPTQVEEARILSVPSTGWAEVLKASNDRKLLIEETSYYFSHSYHFLPEFGESHVSAFYQRGGERIVASLEKENIFGTQFHPEKSSSNGLSVLRNFALLG
jgi:glutamine amidotransferase